MVFRTVRILRAQNHEARGPEDYELPIISFLVQI